MPQLTIRKALNKAYLKVKPNRQQIEGFKSLMADTRLFTDYMKTTPALASISSWKAPVKKRFNFHRENALELEAEIDRLVYELYGLSEEEIGVVENQTM